MERRDEAIEALWSAAESARKSALKNALRDKMLWCDQAVNLLCGMIKAICVAVALIITFERHGFPEGFNQILAALVTMPLLVFNPKAFFWRNLFSARADAAFDEALRNYHRN